jgi:hypothetical protein
MQAAAVVAVAPAAAAVEVAESTQATRAVGDLEAAALAVVTLVALQTPLARLLAVLKWLLASR